MATKRERIEEEYDLIEDWATDTDIEILDKLPDEGLNDIEIFQEIKSDFFPKKSLEYATARTLRAIDIPDNRCLPGYDLFPCGEKVTSIILPAEHLREAPEKSVEYLWGFATGTISGLGLPITQSTTRKSEDFEDEFYDFQNLLETNAILLEKMKKSLNSLLNEVEKRDNPEACSALKKKISDIEHYIDISESEQE